MCLTQGSFRQQQVCDTTKTTITTRAMRPSVRPTTASSQSGTTRATCTSPSTTPMTMLTSTIAWCTPCVERARRAHSFTLDVVSHLIASSPESFHIHPWSSSWRTLFDSLLPFYFHLFFPVFSFYVLHSELYSELDIPIVMESLCYSANKESEDAYDVSTSLTVGGVICLVNSVNERDLSLLNSVKYDSYLITS